MGATHILIIDDDEALLDMLAMTFEDEGFEVTCAPDGQRGLELIASSRPALVISDINMPRLDGFSLCRKLREEGDEIPLILLTSRDSEIDEALGLELGADDYVTKPFSTRVLLARVRSLIRRQRAREGAEPEEERVRVGQLELNLARMEATYAGAPIKVTLTELRMLEVFARRPGVVYSRAQLLDRIRGDDSVVDERLVDTYVRRLRRKFEAVDPDFGAIETVVGAGYRWSAADA